MRNTIFAGLALSALAAAVPAAAAPAPALLLPEPTSSTLSRLAPSAQQGGVRVWMDGARDVYQPGERMRVRVRTDRDGYLAVFMIDTNGDVDIIYPRSPHEDGWIEGGRTLTLGSRSYDYLHVRGGYGMGYVMAVTLDEPLELWRVQELYGVRAAGWDSNRTIFGDPFYAMDELTRAIVPEGWHGYESTDYYTFHVGRRYRYPRYACYDGYGDWYYSRSAYWNDCDRIRVLLVRYPWYYDTYRWRGSRRVYYQPYYRTVPVRNRPLHGYKERTEAQAPPSRTASQRPARRPATGQAGDAVVRNNPNSGRRPQPRGAGGSADGQPDFTRPRGAEGGDGAAPGGRRPGRGDASTGSVTPDRDEPRARPTDRPGTRGTTRPQQDDAQPPQQDRPVQPARDRPTFQRRPPSDGGSRDEPRRESPPQRQAEPRRESPPQRQAQPRRESPPRQAEPRRESPPQRSASPPSSGGSRSSSSDGGGAPRSRPSRP